MDGRSGSKWRQRRQAARNDWTEKHVCNSAGRCRPQVAGGAGANVSNLVGAAAVVAHRTAFASHSIQSNRRSYNPDGSGNGGAGGVSPASSSYNGSSGSLLVGGSGAASAAAVAAAATSVAAADQVVQEVRPLVAVAVRLAIAGTTRGEPPTPT